MPDASQESTNGNFGLLKFDTDLEFSAPSHATPSKCTRGIKCQVEEVRNASVSR